MVENGHKNGSADMNTMWETHSPLAEQVKTNGIQKVFDEKRARGEQALKPRQSKTITCMDGRTEKKAKVAAAESGLYLLVESKVNIRTLDAEHPGDALRNFPAIRKFVSDLQDAGIKNTESHKSCGAGDLYAQFFNEQKTWGTMTGDEAAKLWAQKLAIMLGGDYRGHKSVEPGFHPERAAYYSFADAFDPGSAPDVFLPGYVISRNRFKDGNVSHAAKEMALAATISFGGHGYGARFTKENPFFFIVIAKTQEEAAVGRRELEPIVAQFGGRVQLQVLIA